MAAEVIVGAVVAQEIVSTSIQGAAVAHAILKPTNGLKATFKQIASAKNDDTRLSLVRSDHTCTVVGNKVYIFGGETASGKLASNDIHFITFEQSGSPELDYSVIPAIPGVAGQPVVSPRTKHAACHINEHVAISGGVDESGKIIDEAPSFWLHNTGQRINAKLFNLNNNLVLYGGVDANGTPLKDAWHFDHVSKAWTALASAPVSTFNAALSSGTLYLIDGEDNMSSNVHGLNLNVSELAKAEWSSTSFPTNPLTPGPRPRVGGGLLPMTTEYERNYLLCFFGARQNPQSGDMTSPEDRKIRRNGVTLGRFKWRLRSQRSRQQ